MDPFSGEEGGVREVNDTWGDCSTGPSPGLRLTRSVSTSAVTNTKFDGYLILVPAEMCKINVKRVYLCENLP